ncbi:MAG: iron-containing alcohol dehydrogenase, partial [Lachnospiraceae bacterium]
CTSEHSMEHAMSAFHSNLPHGAGLIMISVAYYTYFAKSGSCDQRMIDMAKALGNREANNPMDFVDALVQLQKDCGVTELRMSDYGIEKSELKQFVSNAYDTMGGLFTKDPSPLSDVICLEMFEKSYK